MPQILRYGVSPTAAKYPVGTIMQMAGSPHLIRVVNDSGLVECFSGTESRQRLVRQVWEIPDAKLSDRIWTFMLSCSALSPYAAVPADAVDRWIEQFGTSPAA